MEFPKIALPRLAWREGLQKMRHELGFSGQLALAVLVLSGAFYKAAVEPMQERAQRLSEELERHAGGQAAQNGPARTAGKLEEFYAYLARDEATTDWLAKLYAIGKATGVELRSGSYRGQPAQPGGKIERYEIVVPVAGSYAQMRDFLARALAEIPVLSLDQMALKRETRNDGVIHAELKMTLHMVKK
jgi:Tfp pilus assembly protein PilO